MLRTTAYPNIIGETMSVNGQSRRVDNIAAVVGSFFEKRKSGLSWFDSDEGNPYEMIEPLAEWIEEKMSLTEDDIREVKKIKQNLKKMITSDMLSKSPRSRPYTSKMTPLVEDLLEYLAYPMDSTFKVGSFTVRTKGNPDTSQVLTCLKKLSKIPFFDYFKKTLYGDILISEEDDVKWDRVMETSNWVAFYDRRKDIIRIRTAHAKICNRDLLKTMIHELAHRYWSKFMGSFSTDAWVEYDKQVRKEGGAKDLNSGDELNNIFLIVKRDGSGYSISERPSASDDTVKLKVGEVEGGKFWAVIDKKNYKKINPIIDTHLDMIFRIDPRAFGPFDVSKYGKLETGLFPSIYAQTNAEEHFCEVVAYYYMNELSDEATKHFKRVLNQGVGLTGGRNVIASSQASWSILSEGVSSSRVEAHIVRNHVNQMIEAIKKNPKVAELIYKLCGDNFEAIPKHLSKMERSLDRTNYALISMGAEWYRQRLTHEDREKVDQAAKYNPTPFPSTNKQSDISMHRKAGTSFEVSDFVEDKLIDDFGFSEVKVLSVKEDREDKDSLYALVHCSINNKWATIYQDDEGDQQVDTTLLDERRTRASFDRETTGRELVRTASVKRVAMRFFDDFIADHIQDLIKLDPEFDDDSSDKSEAIWGGNFDKAKKLTRNRKAKDYIEFMKNKYTVWSENLF